MRGHGRPTHHRLDPRGRPDEASAHADAQLRVQDLAGRPPEVLGRRVVGRLLDCELEVGLCCWWGLGGAISRGGAGGRCWLLKGF